MFRKVNTSKGFLTPMFILLMAVSFIVPLQPPSRAQGNVCPGNLLRNGDLSAGINIVPGTGGSLPPSRVGDWSQAFGTPQISDGPGCSNPGFMRMWGNKVVGEAIQQTLSTPLLAGHTYKVSACVRWVNNNPTLPPYVRFNVRASNGPLTNYQTSGTSIGIIGDPTNTPSIAAPGITSTQWTNITLANWTPTASYNTITINPENNNTANDGATVSWGDIDGLCIQEVFQPELYLGECCREFQSKTDLKSFVDKGNGVYDFTATLSVSQPNIVRVTANVISSSVTYSSPSCGTTGPVNSYVTGAQNVGSFVASIPITNGHEVIWHGPAANVGGLNFPVQIKFPPPPKGACRDELTFCVKYTFTDRNCRTCEVIRCYGPFKRGGPIKISDETKDIKIKSIP